MLERDPNTGMVHMRQGSHSVHSDRRDQAGADILSKHLDDEIEELENLASTGLTQMQSPEFKISLDENLIHQKESSSVDSQQNGCSNAINRPRMWVATRKVEKRVPEGPFLNRLAYVCVEAGIRQCKNEECMKRRKDLHKLMPLCEWTQFREWASVLVSCQASFSPEGKLTRAYTHLGTAGGIFHWLLLSYNRSSSTEKLTATLEGKDDQKSTVDLFGVCEVIYWMITIQSFLGRNPTIEGRWAPEFLPLFVTSPAVSKAIQQARELGLCKNYLWNIALVSERKHVDLPALMEMAVNHPQLRHEKHDRCISGFCRFTALDSTKVRQIHKCDNPATCEREQLKFDPQLLNESMEKGGRTVWTISEPFEVSQDKPYVAVSHVWSDGTGIGLQEVGLVNRCIFNYLADITQDLGYDAIWWDTISIPTDKVARRKAINEMHNNYSRAACTILHDQYLLDYEWADDGSPCLALLFSPWLTRGWTALELIVSKEVKVLYKGHDGHPVIKDLDDHILAKDPRQCTRAHWIASTILRRLRQPIHNVTDLMAVLKPRSTSWPRDRMVIAGLLAGLDDIDYTLDQDDITKAIVDKLFKINPSSLLHGQITIADSGGWSWCPPSLYDMPADSLFDLFDPGTIGDNTCVVDKNGVVSGTWYFRLLVKKDMDRLVPNAAHMSVTLKIKDALRRWQYCLLLRDSWQDKGLALLVCPVGRSRWGIRKFIRCRYVGSVTEAGPLQREAYEFDYFRIGDEANLPDVLAKKFV